MIVRQFLQWVRTAAAGERAEATNALARAFLFSDLTPDDRAAAEGAMIMLLDDASPLVRGALAEVLASSQKAPPAVIQALADDQPEIAVPVIERSPLFIDADLVDIVATGSSTVQAAVARRVPLQCAVAAAIAEVGAPEACLELIENADADIALFSLYRMVYACTSSKIPPPPSPPSPPPAWSRTPALSPGPATPCSGGRGCRRRPARRWWR